MSKNVGVQLLDADAGKLASEQRGEGVHPASDRGQSLRPVIHRIKTGHVREQRLSRADVRRRPLTSDVLFTRLEGHAVGAVAMRIDRHADDATRRLPDVLLERREKRGMRTAISHRHTKALRIAKSDIGAKLARWRQQRQAQQIGPDGNENTRRLGPRDEVAQIVDRPAFVRRLHQRAEHAIGKSRRLDVADDELDAERLGTRLQDIDGLWKTGVGDEELRRARSSRLLCTRCSMVIASPAAVASSSSDAVETSMPVRSRTIV